MKARQQGLNWQPIASKHFPDKTANACRKRHERLMEKRNVTDAWDGAKMEALAKAYHEIRADMWRMLGDRLGEKWSTVEAKVSLLSLTLSFISCKVLISHQCMEKGLKNLQNTGRSASRRERSATNRTLPDPDSLSESFPHHEPFTHRSRSHSHDPIAESFNDGGLLPDISASPYGRSQVRIGGDDDQNQGPHSAGGITNSSSRRSFTPSRTFSSSTSTLSLPGSTPTMTAPPQFSMNFNASPTALSSPQPPLAVPHSGRDHQQTLPSFSAAFSNMPSVLASTLNRHPPSRAPVTTH